MFGESKCLDDKKHFQDIFYQFINDSTNNSVAFQSLNSFIIENGYLSDVEELVHFLRLLSIISENSGKQRNIIDKIEFVLSFYKSGIMKTLSNFEIFIIFENNKLILLFLFENDIIHFDEKIEMAIMNKAYNDGTKLCHFFYPEIKKINKFSNIEKELYTIDPNIFDNFEEKRHFGENDSYICSLIRNDNVLDFISHVNRSNISLNSLIKKSIFETNSFLIGKEVTFIEYAAFFGSIQIIQYLKLSGVKLEPSLWYYSIHSNNPELIHLLEENKVKPEDETYLKCFEESIKCHHNEIAEYIKDVLMKKSPTNLYSSTLSSCNYLFIPEECDIQSAFFYLCKYNYNKIIDFYLKTNEFEKEIITISKKLSFSIKFQLLSYLTGFQTKNSSYFLLNFIL